jgi:regulator of RNase E activity RraA
MSSTGAISGDVVTQLQQYSACDISDALLKLKVPGAGFIADLTPYSTAAATPPPTTIAPVYTVLFTPKDAALDDLPPANIPTGAHWADLTDPGTIVVIKQPPGQTNAVCGGIMALRMMVRQVRGIIVAGRVRDLAELRSTHLPVCWAAPGLLFRPPRTAPPLPPYPGLTRSLQIWARGISTVGSGGGSVARATQVPVEINGVAVCPGDIAVSDPLNGVVVIPRDRLDDVLGLLPRLVAADDRVKEDVLKGMSVAGAFRLHR